MKFFFDLDGPILDVRRRYFQVYADIVSTLKGVPLSMEEYWESKRNKVPDSEILEKSGLAHLVEAFQTERRLLIETERYINLDEVWPEARQYLEHLSAHYECYLVTLRGNRSALDKELSANGIDKYFTSILSSDGTGQDKPGLKYDLITGAVKEIPPHSYFIGDTETDIRTGKKLGIQTIGVSFGIRTALMLEKETPTLIVHSPAELLAKIQEITAR